MPPTVRPSAVKRGRELAKQARRKEKADRRAERKEAKANAPKPADGEDPDLAGIQPGPQAPVE